MGKPKSVGRLPLTSCHESPASSLRITSQCFCMKSTLGATGGRQCGARSGRPRPRARGCPVKCRPRLIGRHDSPAVVGAEGPGRGDGDVHPLRVLGIEQDRVQAHAAGAGLPLGPVPWPRRPAISCHDWPASVERKIAASSTPAYTESGSVARRLEMPDALELPGVRRAVVPHVRAGRAVVGELVVHRLPRLPAVVAPLHGLPEPAAGLRGVDAIGIGGRAFEVIDLPAAEMRAVDFPILPLAVGGEDERALPRAHENADTAHDPLLVTINTELAERTESDSGFGIRDSELRD